MYIEICVLDASLCLGCDVLGIKAACYCVCDSLHKHVLTACGGLLHTSYVCVWLCRCAGVWVCRCVYVFVLEYSER